MKLFISSTSVIPEMIRLAPFPPGGTILSVGLSNAVQFTEAFVAKQIKDLYTAATVLLASRLHPSLQEADPEHSVTESWDHAIEVLNTIARMSESAQKCITALEIISEALTLTISDGPQSSHQRHYHKQSCDREPANLDMMQSGLGSLNGFNALPEYEFCGLALDLNDLSWLNCTLDQLG